ncbi:hypothetical protein [Proteiniphilum sp. UBA5384]|uniref:hypothetical protein n=1 Tax=Proteiniphilum sp. UBA5384 TaxID=1947279 RepID=UPI0025D86595|nr:hypothetical protein [Proteiniphilum sp. UBA5384]
MVTTSLRHSNGRDNTIWSAAITGGWKDRWRRGELHYEDTCETVEKTYSSFMARILSFSK